MITLFFVVACLASIHFILEGILLPSFRWERRLTLFHLRDRLREAKIQNPTCLEDDTFSYLECGLNMAINLLSEVDFVTVIRAHEAFKRDPDLARRVQRRRAQVLACPVREVREISGELYRIMRSAMLINSAGLMLYVVPLIAVVACLQRLVDALQGLLNTPEGELRKLMPDASIPAMAV
jgi:hypothetical protein